MPSDNTTQTHTVPATCDSFSGGGPPDHVPCGPSELPVESCGHVPSTDKFSTRPLRTRQLLAKFSDFTACLHILPIIFSLNQMILLSLLLYLLTLIHYLLIPIHFTLLLMLLKSMNLCPINKQTKIVIGVRL